MSTEKQPAVLTSAILHFPELDGLRGIGISVVVLQHSYVPYAGLAWCFVDLFFVLSGFLITSILLATRGSAGYFPVFYVRRVLRIFPLYFLSLFAVFCVGLPVAYRLGLAHWVPIRDQLWYWLYLSNWWNGLGHNVYYLSHFWTLAIEEQFYLVWPLFVFLLGRRYLAQCCLTLIGVSFLLRVLFSLNGANPVLLQRGTIFKMDTLAMGGLIAVIAMSPELVERVRPHFRYALCAGATLFTVVATVWGISALTVPMITLGYAAVACMSGFFVFHAATNTGSSNFLCQAFRFRALRNLGKYSYGIYVLHYPIVVSLFAAEKRLASHYPAVNGGLLYLPTLALALGACYAAGWASYNFIEKPFLRLKDKFRYESKPAIPEAAQEERNPRGLVPKTEAISS